MWRTREKSWGLPGFYSKQPVRDPLTYKMSIEKIVLQGKIASVEESEFEALAQ